MIKWVLKIPVILILLIFSPFILIVWGAFSFDGVGSFIKLIKRIYKW